MEFYPIRYDNILFIEDKSKIVAPGFTPVQNVSITCSFIH